jgi:hypothetical protein
VLDRRSSGRFTHQRARVGPRLWSRIRKQLLTRSFVLATWSPCRGPRRSAASELAVVPSATPGSPSSNAWTARLRHARPRHIPRPNSLRALHRVPSSAGVCAYSQARQWAETGGSAFEIKTGSESQIAIMRIRFPISRGKNRRESPETRGSGAHQFRDIRPGKIGRLTVHACTI